MGKILLDFIELLFIGSAVFLLAWIFMAEPLEVSGDSMHPTLRNREQIVAEKVSVKFNDPKRGDIIVIKSPQNQNDLLIKRVVALPNEKLTIKENAIYINDRRLNEPYIMGNNETKGKTAIIEGEDFIVPSDSYVVLGDNRKNSTDSRHFGAVKKQLVIGKAFIVYSPLRELRLLNNVDLFAGSGFVNKFYYAFGF
jgi:signal peptidase I